MFTVITYLCIYHIFILYTFSGCDSMSAFHRIHKRKLLNRGKGNEKYCFLLVTFCSLLITFARCSLLFARCSLLFIVARYYSLQITVKYNSCKMKKKKKKEKKEGLSITKLHPRYFPCKFLRFW